MATVNTARSAKPFRSPRVSMYFSPAMKCALALLSLAAVAVARPQYLGQFGHGLGGFGNQFGFGGGATGSSGAQSTQGFSSSPYGGYTGIQSSGVHAQVSISISALCSKLDVCRHVRRYVFTTKSNQLQVWRLFVIGCLTATGL